MADTTTFALGSAVALLEDLISFLVGMLVTVKSMDACDSGNGKSLLALTLTMDAISPMSFNGGN